MNRLQAAKSIRQKLSVPTGYGDQFVHFDAAHSSTIYRMYDMSDEGWERVDWKITLKFIREKFKRRNPTQCLRKYDSGAKCTETKRHFHCARCDASSTDIELHTKLCGDCTEESNVSRRQITNLILNYETDFNVRFKEIKEWRDQFDGNDNN